MGLPDGPMAGPPRVPPGAASRTGELATGITGDPGNAASSLNETAARWNSLSPHQFRPTSVLQQMMPSADGMSEQDARRRLLGGAMLPTANGNAPGSSTYEASNLLRLSGADEL